MPVCLADGVMCRPFNTHNNHTNKTNNSVGIRCADYATTEIIIIIIIIIIQFNSLLFMCRVNSYKANYRHSTVQIYIST
jgi:hypothetical protein